MKYINDYVNIGCFCKSICTAFCIAICFALMACATAPVKPGMYLKKVVTHETADGIRVIEKHYDVVK